MAQTTTQIVIRPVEELILDGICERFQQVFACPTLHTNGYEKTTAMQRALGGAPTTYPYAVATLKGLTPDTESWSSHEMARRGLNVVVNSQSNQAWKAKLLPARFDVQIEYHTNAFTGRKGSALRALSRWLFARRLGYLKYNVQYGRVVLGIGTELAEAPEVPERENITESETVYRIPFSLTIRGWISQPELQRQGVVKEVIQEGQLFRAFPVPGANREDI